MIQIGVEEEEEVVVVVVGIATSRSVASTSHLRSQVCHPLNDFANSDR